MAKEVLSAIKEAEQQAKEKRRVAMLSAKESLKLGEQENAEIKDKELTKARHEGIEYVNEAEANAKKELDALQEKRTKECENLKVKAEKKLEAAADAVIERIIK
jgi:V/A-type H+-transporting ATPase subunit G/H